jgi:hypothetical protein
MPYAAKPGGTGHGPRLRPEGGETRVTQRDGGDRPILRGARARALAVVVALALFVGLGFAVAEVMHGAKSVSKTVKHIFAPSGAAKLSAMRTLPRPAGAVEIGSGSENGNVEYQPTAWVEYRLPVSTANVCLAVMGAFEAAHLTVLELNGGPPVAISATAACDHLAAFKLSFPPEVCTSRDVSTCYAISLPKSQTYRLDYS